MEYSTAVSAASVLHPGREQEKTTSRKWACETATGLVDYFRWRLWWNWQTRYFEVVVGKPMQVQVLLSAPKSLSILRGSLNHAQIRNKNRRPSRPCATQSHGRPRVLQAAKE